VELRGRFGEVAVLKGTRTGVDGLLRMGGRRLERVGQTAFPWKGFGSNILLKIGEVCWVLPAVMLLLWAVPLYLYPKIYWSIQQKGLVEPEFLAVG
jgi:hypothetical protein